MTSTINLKVIETHRMISDLLKNALPHVPYNFLNCSHEKDSVCYGWFIPSYKYYVSFNSHTDQIPPIALWWYFNIEDNAELFYAGNRNQKLQLCWSAENAIQVIKELYYSE